MIYRFAEFELDTRLGTLAGPEEPITLRPQTCRLLEVLVERAPDIVESDELLDLAWGRRALSPNAIPQGISELRHALGDSAQSPRFIETRHRRGYRFICPVEKIKAPADESPGQAASTPSRARPLAWLIAAVAVAVLAFVIVTLDWWGDGSERRWLEEEALPQITSLMETDPFHAWVKLRETRERIPGNPLLEQLWLDLTLPSTLVSEPPGATIEVRDYSSEAVPWVTLGQAPLHDIRLPLVQLRFKASLEDHLPLEIAPSLLPAAEPFRLHRPDEVPENMVFVPSGTVTYWEHRRSVPEFWLDRYEVTNREYMAFVEAGGYQRPELWEHPAQENGESLSFEELMARLVDSTGTQGPSTWALGTFPEGEEDRPVEGISWYEAAAYAKFAGKQLPTAFHWHRAAGLGILPLANFSGVLQLSNFSGRGAVDVGSHRGLGPYGTYDMAGNVAEWTATRAGDQRHMNGGSWLTNSYRFNDPSAHQPLERRPGFGMRLMQQDAPPASDLAAEVPISDYEIPEPVDDATFAIYARQFDYDARPLEPQVESVDDSHDEWIRERITINTAYGGERMIVQVFLPRNSAPPYQAIVHYPGGDALMLDDSTQAGLNQVELFLRSGRAVIYPVYAGMFERRNWAATGPASWRDLLVAQVRDMRRTLDYLETRDDITQQAIMLHALSYGGIRAPFALAVEDRFSAAIILSGGYFSRQNQLPEVALQDYLPRVRLPVLMITGKDDFAFPLESSQKPFFEMLGTPPELKKHMVRNWGHIPPYDPELVRALLEWADLHLH